MIINFINTQRQLQTDFQPTLGSLLEILHDVLVGLYHYFNTIII